MLETTVYLQNGHYPFFPNFDLKMWFPTHNCEIISPKFTTVGKFQEISSRSNFRFRKFRIPGYEPPGRGKDITWVKIRLNISPAGKPAAQRPSGRQAAGPAERSETLPAAGKFRPLNNTKREHI